MAKAKVPFKLEDDPQQQEDPRLWPCAYHREVVGGEPGFWAVNLRAVGGHMDGRLLTSRVVEDTPEKRQEVIAHMEERCRLFHYRYCGEEERWQ